MKYKKVNDVTAVIRNNVLLCPTCGESTLHQIELEAWFRHQDADYGVFAHVDEDGVNTSHIIVGNPSPRRSGMKIMFACERCHASSTHRPATELYIYQHKGETFVEFAYYEESTS